MTGSSRSIAHKLPPETAEVLRDVGRHAHDLHIPFFVLGATARDIIFGALYDIRTSRASFDIDLALRVADWEQYTTLRTRLLSSGHYTEDHHQRQRLHHDSGAVIDLVPFGPVETPSGMIAWPPDQDIVMSTAGFEEALASAVELTIIDEPVCTVKVCIPAALAAMKLIAWHETYPARKKDALDLLFLMKEYIYAGNESRLYDTDRDLLAASNSSFDDASPRLLGRDIRRIVSTDTRNALLRILIAETADDGQFRLLSDMTASGLRDGPSLERVLMLLRQVKRGLENS